MPQDHFRYDKMVEAALRGVVRQALARAARDGLPGAHHFYIGLRTGAPGVVLPGYLVEKFPDQMTMVLQHQFWGLEVGEDAFSVTLSFQGQPERLTVPLAAVTSFADPSVKFGLQFEAPAVAAQPAAPATLPAALPATEKPASAERPAAEIVTLDRFRKR
jgi:hypothetical protein